MTAVRHHEIEIEIKTTIPSFDLPPWFPPLYGPFIRESDSSTVIQLGSEIVQGVLACGIGIFRVLVVVVLIMKGRCGGLNRWCERHFLPFDRVRKAI